MSSSPYISLPQIPQSLDKETKEYLTALTKILTDKQKDDFSVLESFEKRITFSNNIFFFNYFDRITINPQNNNQIIIPAFRINIQNEILILENSYILSTSDLINETNYEFGKDYYIFAGKAITNLNSKSPVFKVSKTTTQPSDLKNPVIIGGFHYGKVRKSITPSDVSNGIVPNSVWDLNHMPRCYLLGLQDPANYQIGGMVEVIKNKLWVDIYLASDGGGSGFNRKVVSKINQLPLTGIEGLNWYDFAIRGANVGKRMLTYAEWTQAAIGSPQGLNDSNLHGWTKTTNTGKIKTAATNAADADANYILGYNTSLLNVRDCVGNVWEWLADVSNRHDSTSWAWHNVLDAGELAASQDFGQAFLPNAEGMVAWIAGGRWADGVYAGSRAVVVHDVPWNVKADLGSRFACENI